jgi:hypothetical protein
MSEMEQPPALAVELMRDLANLEAGRAKAVLLADAEALERRLAARAKLADKR